ncbi:MAG: sulfotransferase family protein [Rhizomicrobium sp.]
MRVIGAGFGRTGTMSLKLALEQLGYAPCYHMVEVFAHPEHNDTWEAAIRKDNVDWRGFLGSYPAGVDWPVSGFWRELSAAFPDAKFILTERDPEAWYASMSQTILASLMRDGGPADEVRRRQAHMGRLLLASTFGGNFDKDNIIAVYKRHNQEVKDTLPASSLLVTDSPEGWAPVCEFLGKPVPVVPFPKTNSTAEFRARARF